MEGGDLWDQQSYAIQGIVNSPGNVRSLEYLKRLYDVR